MPPGPTQEENSVTTAPAYLDLLKRYDTPTVCNVVELFDIRPRHTGFMDRRIRPCFPKLPPMVGFASTATFRSAAPPRGGSAYSGLVEQVESFANLPGPAVVVFQDLDDPPAAATFGEIMCTTYKTFGAAGLITSGAGRDLDQVAAISFPCFTDGTISAHGYCHIPQCNVAVSVGGVQILPGDLLHADCNGVTTIPLEIAADTADACAEFIAAEAVILEYLRGGKATVVGFKAAQQECRSMIDRLATRLRR
jgi:4-hydroxy-4-methyl-2-oxoglutarate aldolase